MLDAIGVPSVDALFDEIPEAVRLGRPLDLPAGKSEQDVFDHLATLAARNRHCDEEVTFIGAGMYDHYVPALIDSKFWKIYKLDVLAIPTNRGMRRKEFPDVIYRTEREKYSAVADEIERLNKWDCLVLNNAPHRSR